MLWQWHRDLFILLINMVLFYQPISADDLGFSTNEVDNFGRTALHRAALDGHYELVRELISVMSYHVNTRDHHGGTPLFLAVSYAPSGDAIDELIDNQVSSMDVDAHWSDTACFHPPNWEKTAIILLENGADPFLRKFPDNGADPFIRNFPSNGDTVLQIAVLKRMINVIDFIRKKFPTAINSKNHLQETPIFSAVRSHSVEAVQCVLGFGAAVSEESDNGDSNVQRATAVKLTKFARIIDAQNQNGQTPIVVAAKLKYWNIVSYLLDQGANPKISSNSRDSLLHIAAEHGKIKFIDFICKKFPTAINSENHLGETPIFSAVRSHSVEAVECFIRYGSVVDEESDNGDLDLKKAAASKLAKIVRIIDSQNSSGQTPLVMAAKLANWNIVSFLLQQGADPMIPTNRRDTLLHIAAEHGQISVIDFICTKFSTAINSENHLQETPIFSAIRSHSVEAVECLIGYGAVAEESDIGYGSVVAEESENSYSNPQRVAAFKSSKIARIIDAQNQSGETPILLAARLEYWNIVTYLLKQGADPTISTKSRDTLLHIAAKHGRSKVVDFICKDCAMMTNAQDVLGETTTFSPARSQSVEAAGCVLTVGLHALCADHKSVYVINAIFRDVRVDSLAINSKNRNGDTPLLVAMKWGQEFAAKALLGHGADTTLSDKYGSTPLHYAAENCWVDVAEYLLLNNNDRAHINAQDDLKRTPLFRAVSMSKPSPDTQTIPMVRLLLQNGADQTIRDELKDTPLEIAASYYMVEMVKLLVKFANPVIINAKNSQDKTPLRLVLEKSKEFFDPEIVQIVKTLIENGADPTIPDKYLDTALHYAAQYSFAKNAEIILNWAKLSGKRIINAPNWQGKTALHLAIHSTKVLGNDLRVEMISVLLKYGANRWIGDDLGMTPVHYAAQISSIEITDLLLKDADLSCINVQDRDLQTPLHLAVNPLVDNAKIAQMFEYLRSKGADSDLRDKNGHSPSDLLKRLWLKNVVHSLRTAMYSVGNRLVSLYRKFS